jgi:hypothetical protein
MRDLEMRKAPRARITNFEEAGAKGLLITQNLPPDKKHVV